MKAIRIFIFLFIFLSFVYADIIKDYGIKLAGSRNWNSSKYEAANNIGIACFLSTSFTDICMLNPQLEYNIRGFAIKKYYDLQETCKINMHFLSLSIFFKNQAQTGKFRPFTKVGPRLDYLLNVSKFMYEYFDCYDPSDFKTNSFSLGYSGAIGFLIWSEKTESFSVEFRYNGDLFIKEGYGYRDNRNFSYEIWLEFGLKQLNYH